MRCVNAAHDPVPGSGTPRPVRILLVEDNDDVRRSTTRILERLGHAVVVARDGVEALAHTMNAEIDLVVTDVLMPRIGGIALVARLRETMPWLPVVFMSGFPGSDAEGAITSDEQTIFLQKPFGHEELRYAVELLTGDTG